MADSPRSKRDIEADIAAARARLSSNVEDLVDEVHPRNIADRQLQNAKNLAADEFAKAKSQFVDSSGGLRTDRVAIVGGSVAGVVTFLVVVRTLIRRIRR